MLFVPLAPKLLSKIHVRAIFNVRRCRADPLVQVPLIAFMLLLGAFLASCDQMDDPLFPSENMLCCSWSISPVGAGDKCNECSGFVSTYIVSSCKM